MRLLRLILLGLGLILSCSFVTAKPSSAPQPIFTPETFIHSGSQIKFPVSVNSLVRVGILRFDSSGNDIGVAYNSLSPATQLAITMYVFPKPEVISLGLPTEEVAQADDFLMQNEFETIKKEMLAAHADTKLIQEKEIFIQQAKQAHQGKAAFFEYVENSDNKKQVFLSKAYLFRCNQWLIEYRITYLQTATNADAQIKAFINALTWPKC